MADVSHGKHAVIPETADDIRRQRNSVLHRFEQFQESTKQRRKRLEDAKQFLYFRKEADELEGWLHEKLHALSDDSYKALTNMQAKIQRHQGFEAEVAAHENALVALNEDGEAMISNRHENTPQIKARLEELRALWDELQRRLAERGLVLKHTLDLVQFLRDCDEVKIWIDEKEAFLKSEDFGNDLDHVEVLQKRFDEFRKDLQNHEPRIAEMNETAQQMLAKQPGDEEPIMAKAEEVNDAWERLKDLAQTHEESLYGAHELQHFNRDTEETMAWIAEKDAALTSDDYGKDLPTVQALQRQHNATERELQALEEKVDGLNAEADKLAETHPDQVQEVRARQNELVEKWNQLHKKHVERKAGLEDSYNLNRFLADHRDLLTWIQETKTVIAAEDLATDVPGAEAQLDRHAEIKGEMDAREDSFKKLEKDGKKLLDSKHYAAKMVKDKLDGILREKKELEELWEDRQALYEQNFYLQMLLRDMDQADVWLAKKQAFLEEAKIGETLDAVENQLKRQDELEKSLVTQDEKISKLDNLASQLIGDKHFASEEVDQKRNNLLERKELVYQLAAERRQMLHDTYQYLQFSRDCDETKIWINEKLKVASDEGYQDPTNLQRKIQKHEQFSSELKHQGSRIAPVEKFGQELIDENHYAKPQIEERLEEIQDLWKQLTEQSDRKGQKLKEASDLQTYNRSVDEVQTWLAGLEARMASDDLGKDLTSVENLQKKHQLLESEIDARKDRIDSISAAADNFKKAGHFDSKNIKAKEEAVVKKYADIQKMAAERRDKLEEARALQQFLRDADDEMDWIKEKEPIASSTNTGRDLIGVQNMLKKQQALQNELVGHKTHILDVCNHGDEMVADNNYAKKQIKHTCKELREALKALEDKSGHRKQSLEDSLLAQQYLADANEAETWMKDKEPIVNNTDYGKDEDSAEALLKKHEALLVDVEAYGTVIDGLKQQAASCKGQPPPPKKEQILALYDFNERRPGEMSIKRGDVLTVLNKINKEKKDDDEDWIRAENAEGRKGFVPANYVKVLETTVEPETEHKNIIPDKQKDIEKQYDTLLDKARERKDNLEESCKAYALVREARELTDWMDDKRSAILAAEISDDPEMMDAVQRKFDELQKDLKANEVHVKELRDVGEELMKKNPNSEASDEIKRKLQAMNESWDILQDTAQLRADRLGSAHQVHRYHRDADETQEWIAEKEKALDIQDTGNDLTSVQRMQRKHEALERDLAAIQNKVMELHDTANRLAASHPDQAAAIQDHQIQVTEQWNALSRKAEARKADLNDAYKLEKFLSDHRDQMAWINTMMAQVSSEELAKDVNGAEALLDRHKELKPEIDGKAPALQNLEALGLQLVEEDHVESLEVQKKLQDLARARKQLQRGWNARKQKLDQCKQLQLFLHACKQADNWMANREAMLKADQDKDNVETMLKKHQELARALVAQEDKIADIERQADELVAAKHYDKVGIVKRKDQILRRWNKLKQLIEDSQSQLGKAQLVRQFTSDADDMDNWIKEKTQAAQDQAYSSPEDIQDKQQKHQAMEAEMQAKMDQLQELLARADDQLGPGGDPAVREKLAKLLEDWKNLEAKSKEKGDKLKEAGRERSYFTSISDLEFWLDEVERALKTDDYGKDLATVKNLIKKHELLEADIKAHEDRMKELNEQANVVGKVKAWNKGGIQEKQRVLNDRFRHVKDLAKKRRNRLAEVDLLYGFIHDVDNELAWINEKTLLVSSEDYGKDLMGVTHLSKKHKRQQAEIDGHEAIIKNVQDMGGQLMANSSLMKKEIKEHLDRLDTGWEQLKVKARQRRMKLDASVHFQQFAVGVEEESAWMKERQNLMAGQDVGSDLAALQNLLKKHEAFETDFKVHKDRVQAIIKQGNDLVQMGSHHSGSIKKMCDDLRQQLRALDAATRQRRTALENNNAYLQFMWKADVVDSWIQDKEKVVKSTYLGDDLSAVQIALSKQDTFDEGLENPASLQELGKLKDQLVSAKHPQSAAVTKRYNEILARWKKLKDDSASRRKQLLQQQAQYQQLEKQYLQFAKMASSFSSWVENLQEELSEPVHALSLEEFKEMIKDHENHKRTIKEKEAEYRKLMALDAEVKRVGGDSNPYTWFTMDMLSDTWQKLQKQLQEHEKDLDKEKKLQDQNDILRKQFAQKANAFHGWLAEARAIILDTQGSLETQLKTIRQKYKEVQGKRKEMEEIQQLAANLEQRLILDNRYTDHSATRLTQQWDQLDQLGLRMQHNIEQQITARDTSGVSEATLQEFRNMFIHYDKDKSGKLDHQEFKSCLRALGYELPMVEKGEVDPAFDSILDMVDPNRDGEVSMQEYIAFMISRETENVQSARDVEESFRAITSGDKPYVTSQELYANMDREVADYCMSRMKPYVDRTGRILPDAYDYVDFAKTIFAK